MKKGQMESMVSLDLVMAALMEECSGFRSGVSSAPEELEGPMEALFLPRKAIVRREMEMTEHGMDVTSWEDWME